KIMERVGEISALRCLGAFRYKPEPGKTHDMIDADTAGLTEDGAQRPDERRKGVSAQCAGRESSQPPILPFRIEQIRRRADVQTDKKIALSCPCMAAAAFHADRKIRDQPDAHAHLNGIGLRSRERSLRQPLQEYVKRDDLRMIGDKGRDGGTRRVAQSLWPVTP